MPTPELIPDDLDSALDLLSQVLSYFDTSLPVQHRAQIATRAIPKAKEFLRRMENGFELERTA